MRLCKYIYIYIYTYNPILHSLFSSVIIPKYFILRDIVMTQDLEKSYRVIMSGMKI